MKPDTPSLGELIAHDQARIGAALGLDSREARLEAQILLTHALAVNRAYLIAHGEEAPTPDGLARYRALLERRLAGEPIAYILGEKEFFGLTFKVGPAVLIPRPETELLVELALERIPPAGAPRILDLGTGSGAIAITLARQRPQAFVVGLDRSAAALHVAQSNAAALRAGNVAFVQGDWLSGLGVKKFDMIVGNPPYIPEQDPHLQQGDLRFEPRTALAAGVDGLDCVRRIVADAPQQLAAGGWLMLEHGYDQAGQIAELFRQAGFSAVKSVRDLAGLERITFGMLGSSKKHQ